MQVDFFFGPGSRYSYLAATQLPELTAQTGAVFHWLPVLSADLVARTGGVYRSPQDAHYRLTDVSRWAQHYSVAFTDIQAEVDWRRWAMACVVAQNLGAAEAYASRLYQEAYAHGRPPMRDDALVSIAEAAGLPRAEFQAALDHPRSAATYEANLQRALRAGAFGVPTFVTEDGALFWGQDRLPLLRDHLLARRSG